MYGGAQRFVQQFEGDDEVHATTRDYPHAVCVQHSDFVRYHLAIGILIDYRSVIDFDIAVQYGK